MLLALLVLLLHCCIQVPGGYQCDAGTCRGRPVGEKGSGPGYSGAFEARAQPGALAARVCHNPKGVPMKSSGTHTLRFFLPQPQR